MKFHARLVIPGALAIACTALMPTAGASTASTTACPDTGLVFRPMSAFPDTAQGRTAYLRQKTRIERAVLCLVNAARTAAIPPRRPLVLPRAIPGSPLGLGGAAAEHAAASVRFKFWGVVKPGKDCLPREKDPTLCDPHFNPKTETRPEDRAAAAGYGRRCTRTFVYENAYVGPGQESMTPRKAFDFWIKSEAHRDNILRAVVRETRVAVEWGSADPDIKPPLPALTYVQVFGACL